MNVITTNQNILLAICIRLKFLAITGTHIDNNFRTNKTQGLSNHLQIEFSITAILFISLAIHYVKVNSNVISLSFIFHQQCYLINVLEFTNLKIVEVLSWRLYAYKRSKTQVIVVTSLPATHCDNNYKGLTCTTFRCAYIV